MTNADFEKIVDTSDEWITTRTGIKERRIAEDGTNSSDMATEALRHALDMAACPAADIDALILGTVTPDYRLPSTACLVQERLGLKNAVAYDIVAACTGFINGLGIARAYIESGIYKRVAVIGVEKLTSITNYNDRNTCVLFGDAAGAAIVAADDGDRGLLSTVMKSDGSMKEWLWIPTGGTVTPYTRDFTYDGSDKIYMNGSEVFKVAVRQMCNAALKAVEEAGLDRSDISLVIPHQANVRIIEAIAKRLKVGMDKVVLNIEKYGNTSAASVPLALDEANRAGRLKEGDIILMVAFGGGMIWGSALMRW
ncbi:MAG: beta-ketoacyl-ACP synthase III [bacterium]